MQIQLSKNADSILSIMLQAFDEYKTDEVPSSALKETVEMITEEMQNGELALIGYIDGQEAAMVRFKIKSDHLYFYRLSVIPEQQGKGLAKELLLFLEQYAAQRGILEMRCKVRMNVSRNMKLYESIGYLIIKEGMSSNLSGEELPVATMSKMIPLD